MSRAPGNLLLREPRERRLELAQEGRVADVLEAEAPAADRRAGTVEEYPRSEIPVYRSAGQRGHYGLPHGMRFVTADGRLGHDRAALLAVRRKAIACDEGSDLVRGQLLVAEFIAGPQHDLQRSVFLAQRGDGAVRFVGVASFACDIDEDHRLPGEAGEINAAPGQSCRLELVQLHRCGCCGVIFDN